jgi:CTP:molybdopterin cytidylyltransferase MocA
LIGGLVLAAGEGRRFGGPKQLAELGRQPLLEFSVNALAAVRAIERIVVVLGANAELICEQADLSRAEVIVADDWSEGIAASLRAGVGVLHGADAIVVLLADQPLIGPRAIAAVLDGLDRPEPATRATYGGVPGHPVLVERSLFAELAELRGDSGARDLLESVGAASVECAPLASADDVDTLEDLERIRGVAGYSEPPATSPRASGE